MQPFPRALLPLVPGPRTGLCVCVCPPRTFTPEKSSSLVLQKCSPSTHTFEGDHQRGAVVVCPTMGFARRLWQISTYPLQPNLPPPENPIANEVVNFVAENWPGPYLL